MSDYDLYLVGPMTGIPKFNFPAFRDAWYDLRNAGFSVMSPHLADAPQVRGVAWESEAGDPADFSHLCSGLVGADPLATALANVRAVFYCEGIALLPGWEDSLGSQFEIAAARRFGREVKTVDEWLGKRNPEAEQMPEELPAEFEDRYLDIATRIIHGARNEEYGHPYDDFDRIARMWSAFLGVEVGRKQVAALMVLLKCGRLTHNIDHEDSWIDMAGYVGCADRIQRVVDGIEEV